MRVHLTPEAEADLAEILVWYSQRGATLGTEFLAAFSDVVRQVEQFPESAAVVHPPFRRALLRRFPYCAFYFLEASQAVVVGCFHAHRDPRVWRIRAGV
jgi:plasmid stabilization system protein ParE